MESGRKISLDRYREKLFEAFPTHLSWGHFMSSASLRPLRRDSSLVMTPQGTVAAADCMMAWENRCLDRGERRCRLTLHAPALSPIRVILLGVPPKALMLSFTHCMAINWSNIPAFPGTSSVSK